MNSHCPNNSSWTSCDQLSAERRDESRSAAGHWVHVLTSEFMDSGGHAHSFLSPCLIWDSIEVFSWRSSCSSGWCSRCVVVVVLMLQSWVCADSLRQHTLSSEVELSISSSQRQHTHTHTQFSVCYRLTLLVDFNGPGSDINPESVVICSLLTWQITTVTKHHLVNPVQRRTHRSDQSPINRSITK